MPKDDLNQDDKSTEANTSEDTNLDSSKGKEQDSIEKLVEQRVAESLKELKDKLDDSYKKRDDALKRVAEIEQRQKEEHLKRLEEDGKHKEILELKLAEANAKSETLQKRNTELARDVKVRSQLSSLQFRNDRAVEIAYKEIVGTLVQDEAGNWKHETGVSIEDYVQAFSKDEENAFLFKVKANSGGGTTTSGQGAGTSTKKNSLFDYSQEEIIKMAREGKLRK